MMTEALLADVQISVNGVSDPVVCKLEKYHQVMMEKRKKDKEMRAQQRARSLKEIMIGVRVVTIAEMLMMLYYAIYVFVVICCIPWSFLGCHRPTRPDNKDEQDARILNGRSYRKACGDSEAKAARDEAPRGGGDHAEGHGPDRRRREQCAADWRGHRGAEGHAPASQTAAITVKEMMMMMMMMPIP